MRSSIFWKTGIPGEQPLAMLEYGSSVSHIKADESLQQPQVFIACTVPLVWLLEEPDKVYWCAVLKITAFSPPLHNKSDIHHISK